MRPKKTPQIRLYIICWAAILTITASLIFLSLIFGCCITQTATANCAARIYIKLSSGFVGFNTQSVIAAAALPHKREYQYQPPICRLSSPDACFQCDQKCDSGAIKCDPPIQKIPDKVGLSRQIRQATMIQHLSPATLAAFSGSYL